MKVVILGSAHPLRGGGIATYNERLAKAYQDAGHEVTIETFSLQYPNFLFPGKSQYSDDPAPKELKINVSVNSINPFNWIKVGYKIRKQRPDLLIMKFWTPFMAPCLSTIARIVKSNKRTKVISIIDNILPHERYFGDNLMIHYFVGGVDGFITMSQSVMDDLLLFDKKKPKALALHPLYDNFGEKLSMERARHRLLLDNDGRYILFFGFIRDYKGLDLLLKAMANEKITQLGVKLVVAGEFYTDETQYDQIIEELALHDKIILHTDFIPNSEVCLYFCATNLVVQPYKSATQSGITQIAYHFNKPMVVTNVGGLAEIVPNGKAGYVVDPDVDEIANAIVDFFENNREAKFVEGVIDEKKRFSWDIMIESIDKLK